MSVTVFSSDRVLGVTRVPVEAVTGVEVSSDVELIIACDQRLFREIENGPVLEVFEELWTSFNVEWKPTIGR